MNNEKAVNKNNIDLYMVVLLFAASFCAMIKIVFFGVQVDEQYAISMAYRIASGTEMFTGLFDPHQLSAFPCVILIKLFMMITGGVTGLVIFLRAAGILIQLLVFVFTYTTLKRKYSVTASLFSSLIVIILLPKYIQTPEFSNLFLWSTLCTFLCLLRAAWEKFEKQNIYLIIGALFYCCAVLAYPSSLILLPVLIYGILREGGKVMHGIIFISVCAVTGILYVGYFLTKMSPSEFIEGIQNMMSDGSHALTLGDKLAGYGKELITLSVHGLAVVLLTVLTYFLMKKERSSNRFFSLLILFSALDQLVMWLFGSGLINRPLAFYYICGVAGFFVLKEDKTVFRFLLIPSFVSVLAVLILTNTTIGFSGPFLLPALVGIFAKLLDEDKGVLAKISVFVFLGVLLFAKGFLVCMIAGGQGTVLMERQKILSGPAKMIYDNYLDGYETNEFASVIDEYVTEDTNVLYLGQQTLRCLMMKGKISNSSTISTPTYDEEVLEKYWEKNPDLRPDIVIAENGKFGLPKNLKPGEVLYESKALIIYKLSGTEY